MWSFAVPAVIALAVSSLTASAPAGDRLDQQTTPAEHRVVTRLPAGFSDSVVARVDAPTALTWTPDGRMVVTSKPGRIVVGDGDGGDTTTALDLSARVCDAKEQGLVGVAVDPAFARNHFVYAYYTHEVRGSCARPQNRVSRFVLRNDDTIRARSEEVLLDHIPSPAGQHIAGDLEFGADDFLYVSVGDGVCSVVRRTHCGPTNDNAQLNRVPLGKILRVDRRGRPPATNPYAGTAGSRRCTDPAGVPSGDGPCREIFASGLRNPFRFARKPGTNRFYVNDVGMDTWEEVNRLRKGSNYGWNVREGHCRRDSTTDCGPAGRFTNPIHDYRHGECRSITGGAFVPRGAWPGWRGSYLYSDFGCGKIFRLRRTEGGELRRSTFLSGARGPVHLRFGPYDGGRALYYLSYFTGTVHRVTRAGANTPPVAEFGYRPDGLTVSFSGAASTDPDAGDRVRRWRWDFGDGTSAVTTTPRTTHTYAAEGPVEASLTVVDTHGLASAPTAKTVHAGEHPPSLTITTPPPEARFAVGDEVGLTADAVDAEDGPLPGSAVTWTVRLRHANHFHPHLGPVAGSSVTTTYPAPENLVAARTSRLVAVAQAVDSVGLTTRVRLPLLPRTVDLVFRTDPGGGRLAIQGERRATPLTVQSWVGYVFPVAAPPDQEIGGTPLVFRAWSDGGRRRHDLVTPGEPTTYVARYRRR